MHEAQGIPLPAFDDHDLVLLVVVKIFYPLVGMNENEAVMGRILKHRLDALQKRPLDRRIEQPDEPLVGYSGASGARVSDDQGERLSGPPCSGLVHLSVERTEGIFYERRRWLVYVYPDGVAAFIHDGHPLGSWEQQRGRIHSCAIQSVKRFKKFRIASHFGRE